MHKNLLWFCPLARRALWRGPGPTLGSLSKLAGLGADVELLMVFERVMKTWKAIPSHQFGCSGAISSI